MVTEYFITLMASYTRENSTKINVRDMDFLSLIMLSSILGNGKMMSYLEKEKLETVQLLTRKKNKEHNRANKV